MSRRMLNVRLREGKDDDLFEAFETLPKYVDRSDVVREALRNYFFNAQTPIKSILLRSNFDQSEPVKPSLPKTLPKLDFNDIEPTKKTDNDDLEAKLNKSLGF